VQGVASGSSLLSNLERAGPDLADFSRESASCQNNATIWHAYCPVNEQLVFASFRKVVGEVSEFVNYEYFIRIN
jgi:hypothetical protein